jgi:hypothetical protein
VPTALILTSSESASSIETQFDQLVQDLDQKLKAKCLMLDEKKCQTTKSAMEHIITKLKNSFGIHVQKTRSYYSEAVHRIRDDESSGGDEIKINIMEEPDSDEIQNSDADMEDENEKNTSSNYVSTVRNPSFGVGAEGVDSSMQMNQSI